MKRTIAILVLTCACAMSVLAQNQQDNRRVIEVSGSAERMVIPDEFTFKITLIERIENKKKISIEQQEDDLRNELIKLGVDVGKDLSIYDMSSAYFRQKKVKDVLGLKEFQLKIRDLNKIAQLQDVADRLNIGRLDLIDSGNSRITEIRSEVKIEAIKAAKAKAEYLLAAIRERLGKALSIKEVDEEKPRFQIDGASSNSNTFALDSNSRIAGNATNDSNLSFTAERIRFVIYAKFEIE